VDRHVLRLIKLWLKAPIEERDDDDRSRRQPVMDSVSRSLASIFASDTRKQNKKMIAERTGILPRTER
jgi:hypothetical protein